MLTIIKKALFFDTCFLLTGFSTPVLAGLPLEPGTLSIDTSSAYPATGYSTEGFVNAVREVLFNKGYTVLEGNGHARLVAEMRLTQVEIGTASATVPPPEAPKVAGRGVAGIGGNMTFSLPSGKLKLVPVLKTRLEIRIRKLGENDILWTGAALTVRPSDSLNGREKIVAAELARAIFSALPAERQGIISVP